jgi:hypothetical protein
VQILDFLLFHHGAVSINLQPAGHNLFSTRTPKEALKLLLRPHQIFEHQVRWAGFSLKQRAWLNITNQRRAYEEQPLLLYVLGNNSGVLQAGAQLQLPALNTGDKGCLQDTPCQLCFPPVVVLCSARGGVGKPNSAAPGAIAAHWDSTGAAAACSVQLLQDCAADLPSCTLEELCSAVEEGALDASSISQAAADALLQRAMAAGDDELLLMLVQADVCLRCSQLALQLLLGYACQVSYSSSSSSWLPHVNN